ncbi:MAG TPA: UxaA family hydrolase [Bacillota bacterium]|nr:UxaA family hydrolase [Bacillota bacterium]HPL53914.1 UxaA family hydrolase [Bacillota bacterium]
MVNSVIMHEIDSVATVTKNVSAGEAITYILNSEPVTIKSSADIPIYHKVAVKSVKKGEAIFKYGEIIGYATAGIQIGDHVHTHNLSN